MSNYTWNSNRYNGQKLQKMPGSNIINSNGNNVRYYSSTDAEIFFGEHFIDDCTNIAFSVQQQSMPLYGYNSFTFDDIALGSRIITGSFSVNFTKQGFLLDVLSTLSQISSRKSFSSDIPLNEQYGDGRSADKLPLWDKGFDISFIYGGKSSIGYGQNITLKTVQITDYSQEFNFVGQPIQEIYQFVAKDIVIGTSKASQGNENDKFIEIDRSHKQVNTQDLNAIANIKIDPVIDTENKILYITINNLPQNIKLNNTISFSILDPIFNKSKNVKRNAMLSKDNEYSYLIDNALIFDIKNHLKNKSLDVLKMKIEILTSIDRADIKKTFTTYAKLKH